MRRIVTSKWFYLFILIIFCVSSVFIPGGRFIEQGVQFTATAAGKDVKKQSTLALSVVEIKRNSLGKTFLRHLVQDDRIYRGSFGIPREPSNLYTLDVVQQILGAEVDVSVETTQHIEGRSIELMTGLIMLDSVGDKDLSNGKKITGTGSIDENGIVRAVDLVDYKLKSADEAGYDYFLLSVDQPYTYTPKHVKIMKVTSLMNTYTRLDAGRLP